MPSRIVDGRGQDAANCRPRSRSQVWPKHVRARRHVYVHLLVFRYRERVVWVTVGNPPNIISVLARVAAAQQQDSQGHPPFPQVNGRSSVAAGS